MSKKPRIVKIDGKWDVELDRFGPYDMDLVRAAMDYCKQRNDMEWLYVNFNRRGKLG